MTSEVSLTSAVSGQQNTQRAEADFSEDFLQFLNLLTVQLQNQDPLDPTDTEQLTDQLTQFSQLEQQINTNDNLNDLVALELGSSFSSAQNYVGLDASYVSSEIPYDGSTPAQLTYALSGAASAAVINISDESGNVVFSTEANRSVGAHEFVWNGQLNNGGRATAGTYNLSVDATDSDDQIINTTTVVRGTVRGVETQNGQIFLLIGERAVAASNVLNTTERNSGLTNNNAFTSALSYIGLDITYPNSTVNFEDNGPVDVEYELTADANRGQFFVFDNTGEIIFSDSLDTEVIGTEFITTIDELTGNAVQTPGDPITGIASGRNTITWDGRLNNGSIAEPGEYTFSFDFIGENDVRIPFNSTTQDRVTGVETEGGEIFLAVDDGRVALSNVSSIQVPPPNTDPLTTTTSTI